MMNEQVLHKIKEKRNVWGYIQSRRDKMIWQVLRYKTLLKRIIEGNFEGKIKTGSPSAE